jgi:hypothetical protein
MFRQLRNPRRAGSQPVTTHDRRVIRTLIDAGTITAVGGALAAVLGATARIVQAVRRTRRQRLCDCECDCCMMHGATVGG